MDMNPLRRYMACWPRPIKPMLILSFAVFFLAAAGAADALIIPAGIMMPAAPIAEALKKSLRTMF